MSFQQGCAEWKNKRLQLKLKSILDLKALRGLQVCLFSIEFGCSFCCCYDPYHLINWVCIFWRLTWNKIHNVSLHCL